MTDDTPSAVEPFPKSRRMRRPDGSLRVPPGERCNARTKGKDRHLCTYKAGYKTDHPGIGRCYLHGGCSPSHAGRYSTVKLTSLRELIAQFERDPDPLNVLPELAAMRALFQDFIDRYTTWSTALLAWYEDSVRGGNSERPRQILDISDAAKLLAEATKIVERVERIRAANAISRPDLARVLTEMARVVERYVMDPAFTPEARLQGIRDAWLAIRVA